MVLKVSRKYVNWVLSCVCKRTISLSIASLDQIRKAAWLMLLRFDCEDLFVVGLAGINLSQNAFKVRVNNVWDFHLFVIVRECHLVLLLFWHLRSCWAFQQAFALGFVPFKQISCFVAVKAAFVEMFAVAILALVKQ